MDTALNSAKVTFDASTWALVRRLFSEGVRPYLPRLMLAILCMALSAGATAMYAWLMDPVINKIFVARKAEYLWPLAATIIATFAVKGAADYGESVFLSKVGLRVIADMQNRIFSRLMELDVAYFHQNSSGKLLSRLTNDVNSMRFAVTNALTGAGKDASSVVFLIALMFYQDWVLAGLTFFVFPIAILPIRKIGRRMRKVTANTQEQTGQLSTYLTQAIQGIRVVKAYGMEDYERQKVGGLVSTLHELTFKASRVRAASSPIMEMLGGVAITVVIVYGGSQVIALAEQDPNRAGAFFSFITALMLAYKPMKALASLNTNLQEGLAAAARCFEVVDAPIAVAQDPDADPLRIQEGSVRFERVVFAYDDSKSALDGVSFQVPGGKTVALVGPSGAGKSTILNLLPRFFDAQQGRILIDNQDVRTVTLASLRSQIALVSQEIVLFDDTIRANIAYGRPSATFAEIEEAARHAAAHDFILSLPDGYDTMVGERGLNLSGGQRQRLAIARAMLKNAPILLLDEATSALDTESERQVQAALERLMHGRTTIVIAHRLSTVVNADLIHVMDRGRVIESGPHAALLSQDGLYARLYAMQFSDDTETKSHHSGEAIRQ